MPVELHKATSIGGLNSLVAELPSSSVKLLINTAAKMRKKAEDADRNKDEEESYILYMRYFKIVQSIQSSKEYKLEKKYYDGLLDPKYTLKVIEKAEQLVSSLEKRYKKLPINRISKSVDVPQETKNEKEKKSNKELSHPNKSKPEVPSIENGLDPTVEKDFIPCKSLFSLINEKCSSFIVLDIRSKDDFDSSHMKLSNIINIPGNKLHKGFTAARIEKELNNDERNEFRRRKSVDHLIICDWSTESHPLPQSITALTEALAKWDPGKAYNCVPKVLSGGYEMWCLMYPMKSTNPRVKPPPKAILSTENSSLDFDYPDLDHAFISTPSPAVNKTVSAFNELGNSVVANNTTISQPSINRLLKPTGFIKGVFSELDNGSNIKNSFNDEENDFEISKMVNKTSVLSPHVKELSNNNSSSNLNNLNTLKKNLPIIPSRTLKPKELLENLKDNKEMEKEKHILEESLKLEQDTIKKLSEIEQTQTAKEQTADETMRAELAETVLSLQEQVTELKSKTQENDADYNIIRKQNEELHKIIKNMLNKGNDTQSLITSFDSNIITTVRSEDEDEKKLQFETDKRKALMDEVEKMRKQRIEHEQKLKEAEREQKKRLQEQMEKKLKEKDDKEKRLNEQLENEKKWKEQQEREKLNTIKNNENRQSPTSSPYNRSSRHNQYHAYDDDRKIVRGESDRYRTTLRGSPKSSPVRGGSNLNRSHSAFNLSQLIDEEDDASMPNFDRKLKPFVTTKKRNVNLARQRNFEPKYGNVKRTRTGLKNLGNTCFMNSIIQCLNNTTLLAQYFVQGNYSEDINGISIQKGEVAEEFGAVIQALWRGQYRSISMWDLKTVMGRYHTPFHGYDQHDSHEFLIKLMDWLHDDLNKITHKFPPMKEQNFERMRDEEAAEVFQQELEYREQSFLKTLFHGLHRSIIHCDTCGHKSLTFEPFSILTLSFTRNGRSSLKDMLEYYYKPTRIDYKCGQCKHMRNCTRKLDIWKLPPILIIHLNRFEHDILMKKKQNNVDFPIDNLNLSNHTVSNNRNTNFDLYGISNHYGTIDGGHYTAFCKSSVTKSWLKFDDHEVYDIPRESVKTSAAYILFYECNSINIKELLNFN